MHHTYLTRRSLHFQPRPIGERTAQVGPEKHVEQLRIHTSEDRSCMEDNRLLTCGALTWVPNDEVYLTRAEIHFTRHSVMSFHCWPGPLLPVYKEPSRYLAQFDHPGNNLLYLSKITKWATISQRKRHACPNCHYRLHAGILDEVEIFLESKTAKMVISSLRYDRHTMTLTLCSRNPNHLLDQGGPSRGQQCCSISSALLRSGPNGMNWTSIANTSCPELTS